MSLRDREFDRVYRRLDMMITRGVINSVDDSGGCQTMQVDGYDSETLDDVERFQSYGISTVPKAGTGVLVACVSGVRDQPVVIAVNDEDNRPRGNRGGETVLYNDQGVTLLLSNDGDLVMQARRDVTVEAEEAVTVKAAKSVLIEAAEQINLNAPDGVFANGTRIDL